VIHTGYFTSEKGPHVAKKKCIVISCLALFFISGCASKQQHLQTQQTQQNLFVLLPDPDGKVGQIIVSNPKGTTIIDQAGQALEVKSAEQPPSVPFKMAEKEILDTFGPVLEAQPESPLRYIIYFEFDSTILTEQSRNLLPQILKAIRERRSVDISVAGHTDTAGEKKYNFKLSRKRAFAVAARLISNGADPKILEITSHGEENLLIITEDNVFEPLNRRVEIIVR
jgi:outer membrane protein OmpA-like peptidoglycan-associated protein